MRTESDIPRRTSEVGGVARQIELRDLLYALRRWWLLVFGLVAAGAIAAGFFALFLEPTYRSEALLIPTMRQEASPVAGLANRLGVASLGGLGVGGGQSVEALAFLTSRALTEEFILNNGLLPILFPDDWDAAAGDWKVLENGEQPTIRDAYRLFDREIRHVHQDPSTGLVQVSVEWTDPVVASEWARGLIELVNERMRERVIDQAAANIRYLENALAETELLGLQQALSRLMEEEIEEMMLARVTDQFAFRVIDPPVPSDTDDPVKPRLGLFLLLGSMCGLTVGLLVSLRLSRIGFFSWSDRD